MVSATPKWSPLPLSVIWHALAMVWRTGTMDLTLTLTLTQTLTLGCSAPAAALTSTAIWILGGGPKATGPCQLPGLGVEVVG